MRRSTRFSLFVTSLAAALWLASPPASAADRGRGGDAARSRHTTTTGPRGGQWSKDVEAHRTGSGYQKNTTWTDRQGREATRQAEVVNDPAAGVRTRDVTFTGRDGQVRTRQDVTTKTDSGRTRASTFTGAQGQTASRVTETPRGEGAE